MGYFSGRKDYVVNRAGVFIDYDYSTINSVIFGASAVGIVWSVARYSFLKRKSCNETYKERIEADIKKIDKTKEIIADESYKAYLKQREELRKYYLIKRESIAAEHWMNFLIQINWKSLLMQ